MRNKRIEELQLNKYCTGCIMESDNCTKKQKENCFKQYEKRARASICSAREESGNAHCAAQTPARVGKGAGACVLVPSHKSQETL